MLEKMFNVVLFACLSILFSSPFILSSATETSPEDAVFARINDRAIHYSEFMTIFRNAVRNKFYHGDVPKAELIAFQQKVSSDIIDQILLKQDAEKLGIKPDLDKIKSGLKAYDERYSKAPGWQPRSETQQQQMLDRLSQTDVLEQIERRVKAIAPPDASSVRKFYQDHPEKFTEPKRQWVSVILLPVPPSADNETWVSAENVAKTLIDRVRDGAEFSTLAKEFSAHASAVNGGDLGYLHQNMLDTEAQNAVDKLEINEISPPVRVLQGVTIFQLNGTRESKLNPLEKVKKRAADLLYRDMQEKAWTDYLASLRQSADIFINEDLLASED